MNLNLTFDDDGICLRGSQAKTNLLARLLGRKANLDLSTLSAKDRDFAYAIADLRALADDAKIQVLIDSDRIKIPHRLAAMLDAALASTLGLPEAVDYTLKTDAEGIVGSSSFRLRYEWVNKGQRQLPRRTGAILETASGPRRIPIWMLEAIEIADNYRQNDGDTNDWEALARFRKALEPGVSLELTKHAAKASLTDFLSGLEVRLADRFSISPRGDSDFEIVPFSSKRLKEDETVSGSLEVIENMGELDGFNLSTFQKRVRDRGALAAYRLSSGSYLVIDQAAAPALSVMVEMQRASTEDRKAFIQNPQARITEAVEASLLARGKLADLPPIAQQEAIEAAAGPLLVETKEFSDRVTGIIAFEKMTIDIDHATGTTWLPEDFSRRLQEALASLTKEALTSLREQVATAVAQELPTVSFGELSLPARPEMVSLIDRKIDEKGNTAQPDQVKQPDHHTGPLVLESEVNFEELTWHAKLYPRTSLIDNALPTGIKTPLKAHQIESFTWQVAAWQAGLPGILNADEQGLGKTLQTIAFLAWLKEHMAKNSAKTRGPVLVVAPTSLLENWEQEVKQHMLEPGLGHLIRLYGSNIGGRKAVGVSGKDTDDATAKLDLASLHEAIDEGRAHRFWMLTTYTTLTNYQHSLARIPFSAVVFDEIQALKNPVSLRAIAARAMNADFRIGLTGTPIENATVDLWAIMDQLAAGSLDSLKEFRSRYSTPEADNMAELYERTFRTSNGCPPLATRRLKDEVAIDLPTKCRSLHPRIMPPAQANAYDDARLKLASGGLGAQLKMLHHIRTVSVHPSMATSHSDDEFVAASARLSAAMDILRGVNQRGEKALVFIEHRQMQYRFVELVRATFGLERVDLINGDTPIHHRQAIVNRFQQHLMVDGGFDLLVLGPKAAGTGLTLTAATNVIHLSRWWNPAVEEQCNDRVHRLGQTRPVSIHLPMAIHPSYREQSFDCLLQSLMTRKRRLASAALWPMGDTENDVSELRQMMSAEATAKAGDPLLSAMEAMFARDNMELPRSGRDGSFQLR